MERQNYDKIMTDLMIELMIELAAHHKQINVWETLSVYVVQLGSNTYLSTSFC